MERSIKDSDDSCCSSTNDPQETCSCDSMDKHHHHDQLNCSHSPFYNNSVHSSNGTVASCCQCQKPASTVIYMDEDTCSDVSSSYHHPKDHLRTPTPLSSRDKKKKEKERSRPVTPPMIDPLPQSDVEPKEVCQPNRKRKCAVSKGLVYLFFLMIILGGIATFFCWPRTPMVVVGSHAERQGAATTWATTPEKRPWMDATWLMNITLDNRDNFIPTRLTRIEFTMVDSLTQNAFATAVLDDLAIAPKMLVVLSNTVFHAHYSARSDSDTTWQDLYRACGPQVKQGVDRPALNINIKIVFHFLGIVWTSTVNASPPSGGFVCPP